MAATDSRGRRAPPRAGLRPFGVGETKPHHFLEIFRTAWENKRHPLFAWRGGRGGGGDGCPPRTTGGGGFPIDGGPLSTVRLKLPQAKTAEALGGHLFVGVFSLRTMS